ncbi:bifunctional DNA primase/polymerase, partial [Candidatus Bipolaricaulota bacterium]|nr:bifunctional DNA primase/polymerase [Candidatus Bipolaricaulota bacterium]
MAKKTGPKQEEKNGHQSLLYASWGWPVLPLCWPTADGKCVCGHDHKEKGIGKAPLTQFGVHDATTDPDTIRAWWQKRPQANIGVDVQRSGLLVVDIDSEEALEEAKSKGLPPTRIHKTGKGWHYIYRNPWPGMASAIKKGTSGAIDIKTTGYVVMPPSRHRNGSWYEVELDIEPSSAPDWAGQYLSPRVETREFDLPSELPELDLNSLRLSHKIVRLIKTGDATGFRSRSEAGFAVITSMVEEGYSDPEIAGVVLRNPIADYVCDRNRNNPKAWLAGEIARAKGKRQPKASVRGAGATVEKHGIQTATWVALSEIIGPVTWAWKKWLP